MAASELALLVHKLCDHVLHVQPLSAASCRQSSKHVQALAQVAAQQQLRVEAKDQCRRVADLLDVAVRVNAQRNPPVVEGCLERNRGDLQCTNQMGLSKADLPTQTCSNNIWLPLLL